MTAYASMYGPYRTVVAVGPHTATGTRITLECGHQTTIVPHMDAQGMAGDSTPCVACKEAEHAMTAKLQILSHTHATDGTRHDGPRGECPWSLTTGLAWSNRLWAHERRVPCAECGHVTGEVEGCDCCALATTYEDNPGHDPEVTARNRTRLRVAAAKPGAITITEDGPDASCRYCGTSAEYADAIAHRDCPSDAFSARCESGWTGDRCTFPLGHEGPHSNE